MKEKIDTTVLIGRIVDMCQRQNISVNKMLQNSNSDKSVVDNLKKGSAPSVYAVEKVANYFNCSVDYLLGRTDNPNITSETYNNGDNGIQNVKNGTVNINQSDEDYDIWEQQYEQERDKLYDKRRNAWINAFAAQFPNKKNEWFANVIRKFIDEGKANGETFHISAKQYEYFSRYCCHEDDNKEAWKCYKTYCRCCGCLITLERPRYGGYYMIITILTA